MFKYVPIYALLVAVAMSSANAQQQEEVLRTIEVPNAAFDIVLSMTKPGSRAAELRSQPDPRVVYLMGGDLVGVHVGEMQKVFSDTGALTVPACAFHAAGKNKAAHTPVAVYVIPKGETPLAPAVR